MAERALILLVVVIVLLAAWRAFHLRAARRRDTGGLGSLGYRPGHPAVLYFTSPDCAPCESVQRPALDRLAEHFDGRLLVLEVDATRQSRLADGWGVLSVPTTFLIDSNGRVRRVNHGPTREGALLAQFNEIGEGLPGLQSAPEPHRAPAAGEGKHNGTTVRLG